jgi:DNA adenine methylase
MKYTGSKARISKEITQIFNKIIVENNVENYIEPFVGGANVIENIVCKNKYGFDNNKYLIAFWKAMLDGYIPPEFISKEMYAEVKQNKDAYEQKFTGLVGICASYNGNWFSSYGAISETKINTVRNYYQESLRNINKQLPNLTAVKFQCREYQSLKTDNMRNCFIYCDPPYAKNKKVYNDKDFNHEEFWNWCRNLSENNFVVISEYQGPEDFSVIWEKQLSKMFPKQKKDTPTEKLFVYQPCLKTYKNLGEYYERLP